MTTAIKTVLVTGGLGFIGGRVIPALLATGLYRVRIGSRKQTLSKDIFPAWAAQLECVGYDLFSGAGLEAACTGVDAIVHLAALNEGDSTRDPEVALLVTGLGTLKLLRAAEATGVQRFLYFSTAHVYGSPLQGVITEQTLARPGHPYSITHRVAEDFVLAAHDRKTLTGIVARCSNGFGAAADSRANCWMLLVNDLCRQAVMQRKLVLKSSGLQWRDFITLHDVGRAVIHLLQVEPERVGNGLFNLGGELALRVLDVTERIAERCEAVFGFRPVIEKLGATCGTEQPPLNYSIDKLKATGFAPAGSVDAELDAILRLCANTFVE